ncbi:MAG: hypothetical protein HC886_11090 [Leptolyngbyaceae cyanobacterium SM1_1_3]|nr:hypothetical protein [Leptolyngbyaceae cyanobacterium SM1_1_3]
MYAQDTLPVSALEQLVDEIRLSRKITRQNQWLLMRLLSNQLELNTHQAALVRKMHEWLQQGRVRVVD